MNSAWNFFKQALDILKKDWKYLLKTYFVTSLIPLLALAVLGVVFGILTAFAGTSGNSDNMGTSVVFGVVAAIAIAIVLIWTVPVLLLTVKSVIDGKYPGIKELFGQAKKYIIPLLWSGLLAGLAISAGLIFLIIPGIILSVWFAFTSYVVIEDGVSGFAALQASRNLARGRFFSVLGYTLFLGLVSFVLSFVTSFISGLLESSGISGVSVIVSLASAVISIIIQAAAPIYLYLVFRHLKSTKV